MANRAVEILLRAKDLASEKISKLNQRIKTIGSDSSASAEGTNRLSSSVSSLTGRIGAFIGATAGFVAVKGLFQGVINTGSKFETLNTQLAAVMGTVEEGEQAFSWIKEFTKETPFQLEEVTTSFVKLKAFGLDPMDGTMQKLVDQASKLGGGQEKLNGVILAVGQAWAKQKLQAEETLQLVERGVPVYDLLSKALGKTTAEIQQMSADGELGRDAISALINEMGSDSVGAAAAEMQNFRGIVSNLKDTFVEFLGEVSDQGVLDYLKSQLSELAGTIKRMKEDGSLKEIAKDISDFMVSAAENTKSLVTTIIRFSGEIKALAIAMVAVKFGSFLRNLTAIAPAAIAAARSMKLLTASLVATGWGAVAFGIGLVISKFYELNNINEETAELNRRTAENIQKEAKIWSDFSTRIGVAIAGEQDLKKAIEEGLIVWDTKTKQYENAAKATKDGTEALSAYEQMLQTFDAELANNADQTQLSLHTTDAFNIKLKEITESGKTLAETLEKMTEKEFKSFVEQADLFVNSPFADEIKRAEVEVAILDEAFKRLNVDTELFASGMSTAGSESITAFQVISNSANVTADIIEESFDKAIKSVSTKEGFDQLTQTMKKLGQEGKLSGKQVAEALKDIKAAAEKANKSLQELLSSINSADALEGLNDIATAASSAFDDGKISAQEYLDIMTSIEEKRSDVIDGLKKQAQEEDHINNKLRERLQLQNESKQKEEEVAQVRTVAIQQTNRQAESYKKAKDEVNASTRGVIRGIAAYFRYLRTVDAVARKHEEASQSAEDLADKVLLVSSSTNATESEMRRYVEGLESAIRGGKDLDAQALSKLQAALSAAKSKMQALKSETQSAKGEVASLAGELASLEGDQLKVQQLEYQQRRLDIEQKIAQAQAEGNNEAVESYKQSLSLLAQINKKKRANIRADQQESKSESNPVQAKTSSLPSAARTTTIQFKSPDGKAVSGSFSGDDANKVIDILKNAGASTA